MKKRQFKKLKKQIDSMPMNLWLAKSLWNKSQLKAYSIYHDRNTSFYRLEAKKYREARKEEGK